MFQRTATTAITSPSSTDVIPSMGFHGNYNGYNYPYDSSESCTDEYRDAMSWASIFMRFVLILNAAVNFQTEFYSFVRRFIRFLAH